jgi:hypothetical protein
VFARRGKIGNHHTLASSRSQKFGSYFKPVHMHGGRALLNRVVLSILYFNLEIFWINWNICFYNLL